MWHIETSIIRRLDGTRAYIHAFIDNFSRHVLAWRTNERFDTGASAEILIDASGQMQDGAPMPRPPADQGVEERNASVNALSEGGTLKRILAMVDINFSKALIQAWWRSLKQNRFFLHRLDSVANVRRLVGSYVEEHNASIPHSAFKGQTPDEVYFGTGDGIPERLAEARAEARRVRMERNRPQRCAGCA